MVTVAFTTVSSGARRPSHGGGKRDDVAHVGEDRVAPPDVHRERAAALELGREVHRFVVVPPSWSIRPPRSGKVAQGDDRLDERLLQAVTEVLRAVAPPTLTARSWSPCPSPRRKK